MKQRRYVTYWMLAVALWGGPTVFAEPFAEGSYLGQTPPDPRLTSLPPGSIFNTGQHQWEAFGTFSAQGKALC